MASEQIPIDWSAATHELENNKFSQKNLDKHRHKFTGQAAITMTILQQGLRLTADYARELYHINHVARRIGDIGDKLGVDVDREWGLNKDLEQEEMIVYFLPENRAMFIKKKWIIDRPRWWYSDKYTDPKIINEILTRKKI